MSLTVDVRKIKNFQETCYTEDDDGLRYTGIVQSLAFLMIPLGVNPITEKNYKEFYTRLLMYAAIQRNLGTREQLEKITLSDIKAHIGLETNVSPETPRKWEKKLCLMARNQIAYNTDLLKEEEGT
tara:strand:+ start:861 stop:1238 length:378 start_codon:yes stop_codon:yes gene_type:complete